MQVAPCLIKEINPVSNQSTYFFNLSAKPVFTVEPSLQFSAYENRDSRFDCKASGSPKPNIEWKRSGGRPLPKDGRHIVIGTTLILRNPRRTDSDIYICEASNAGGTAVAGVDVTVNKFGTFVNKILIFVNNHFYFIKVVFMNIKEHSCRQTLFKTEIVFCFGNLINSNLKSSPFTSGIKKIDLNFFRYPFVKYIDLSFSILSGYTYIYIYMY